jgi:hypothetical protein
MTQYLLALPKRSFVSSDFPGIKFMYLARNTLDWNYWHVSADLEKDITLACLKGIHSYWLAPLEPVPEALQRFSSTLPDPLSSKARTNIRRILGTADPTGVEE